MNTHEKALAINLATEVFGSFAEIGAGQEVARWFLRVGGASGTVAKTVSAYDKEVSDNLYGAGTRYVSRPRLEAMLENEWQQLLSQLQHTRGTQTCFFCFVDTIAARNYAGTNQCHGWMGLRFLQQPYGPINDVILHLNLKDRANLQQQEAVGILGVNLIYAAVHRPSSISEFLSAIFEELGLERLEIDLVDLRGPAFEGWDKRLVHVSLVSSGVGEAVAFPVDGELLPPIELLYKEKIVLAPRTLDSAMAGSDRLIEKTLSGLQEEELGQGKGGLGLFCISCATAEGQPPCTAELVLRNVNELQKLGRGVLVFRQRELYKVSAFVNRFTKSRIYFAIELSLLIRALQDNYQDLPGSLLEGIATLLQQNVRLSVHPLSAADLEKWLRSSNVSGWRWKEMDGMVSADDLHPGEPLDYLYQYLLGSRFILPVRAHHARAEA